MSDINNPGSSATTAFSQNTISGAAGAISLTSTYTTLLVGTSGGAASFALPAAGTAGRQVLMVDYQGDSGTNNITTTVSGGGTINGASSLVTNANYTQQLFVDNGSSWNA